MNKTQEEIKKEFVGYLYDQDIRNENGLKSLNELVDEYPEEWSDFIRLDKRD